MSDKLEPEQLRQVWNEYLMSRGHGCREKLITHYLHLVKYVIGRLAFTLPPHIKVEDMYSTGVIGLVKAIEKYEPERKNKFETYAILLIKGAIIDEMRALDWVPRSVHQKANLIAEIQSALEQKLGREASDEEVAKEMGMELKDYEQLLDRVRPAIFISLSLNAEGDGERGCIGERIADNKTKTSWEDAAHNEFRSLLEEAISHLPEQERTVLVLYYYENMTLKEIGQAMGVSESRASQVHTKAIMRLKTRLKNVTQEYSTSFY